MSTAFAADLDPAPNPLAPLLIAGRRNPLMGVITSHEAFGLVLHRGRERCYGRNRSRKARGESYRNVVGCEWCQAGETPDWHGYVSVLVDGRADEHVIVRLGPDSLDSLADCYDRGAGSLRGAYLRAFTHRHGVEILKHRASAEAIARLPDPLPVPKLLGWMPIATTRKDEE